MGSGKKRHKKKIKTHKRKKHRRKMRAQKRRLGK
ncbi:MAG: AURKAIP1/COX24 domain-containing protein [candidate division FCPU426 bacterium]